MEKGVADRVPSAIVDLDHTELSKSLTRNLNSLQTVDIQYKLSSYTEAMDYMKEGKIMGFFMIPEGFSSKLGASRHPELTYYINFAYFVPGSLLVKGFNKTAILANGATLKTTLTSVGAPSSFIGPTLQPFVTDVHPLNNPWLNYSYYLSNSFVPGMFALMVMLMTAYTITVEIKRKTSVQWIKQAGGSILVALFGKLLPQTIVFTVVGCFIQVLFYGFCHFPMNGNIWHMFLAMFLLVLATQSFAILVCSIVPNMRFSLSICSLVSILAFSLGGYSFPVESMYSGIAIYSYILPIRYYFLIYIDQALNGLDFAFSRYYYAALLIFVLLPFTLVWRLKKACMNPTYIP